MALILCVGSVLDVMDARTQLLREHGYKAWATSSDREAIAKGSRADAFVLCEALSYKRRIALALKLRELYPTTPCVVLLNNGEHKSIKGATKTVYAKDGSNILLQALREVLSAKSSSAVPEQLPTAD